MTPSQSVKCNIALVFTFIITSLIIQFDASANNDIRLSGFGSLVGGIVLDGDGYWARQPEGAGKYVDGIELQSESRLGIQADYKINPDWNITGQLMVRGVNEFKPELEWFYASYKLTAESTLKVGRMRLPVYHFSDYMDVGVAYPWLRVPSDAYSLAVTNYQGVNIDMNFDFDSFTSRVRLYTGSQSTDPNKLITDIEMYKAHQLYDANGRFRGGNAVRTTKDYQDFVGFVVDSNKDEYSLRISYLDGRENFTYYNPGGYPDDPLFGGDWVDTQFLDVSLQYDNGQILAIAEWNKYDTIYKSWFASVAYRTDTWSPYVFYSEFIGEYRFIAAGGIKNGYEDGVTGTLDDDYSTIGIGARYNLNPRTALKIEFLSFMDDGDAAVFIDQNQDGKTESSAVFFSIDFAF